MTDKTTAGQDEREAFETLNLVCDVFGIGSAARTRSTILANVENAYRRSSCLWAIEHRFFMETEDDEDGEPHETCKLNWGDDVDRYVERFSEALSAFRPAEPVKRWVIVRETVADDVPGGPILTHAKPYAPEWPDFASFEAAHEFHNGKGLPLGWVIKEESIPPDSPSVGDWLWGQLMDYCKKRVVHTACHNELFAIVGRARKQFTPPLLGEAADRADKAGVAGERDASYRRMFEAACVDLGLINEALGLDPNDGGAVPILDAIKELQSHPIAADRASPSEVQELFINEDAEVIPGLEGDKPLCRFVRYTDGGDCDAGMPSRTYWSLSSDQTGTELAELLERAEPKALIELSYDRLEEIYLQVAEATGMLGDVCRLEEYKNGERFEHFVPGMPWTFCQALLKAVDAERATPPAESTKPAEGGPSADNWGARPISDFPELQEAVRRGLEDGTLRMGGATKPAGVTDAEVEEAVKHVAFALLHAYENGLHEYGYDPISTIREALATSRKHVEQGREGDLGVISLSKDGEGIVWLHFNAGLGQLAALSLNNIVAGRGNQGSLTTKAMSDAIRAFPVTAPASTALGGAKS